MDHSNTHRPAWRPLFPHHVGGRDMVSGGESFGDAVGATMKQTRIAQVMIESVELDFVDPQGEATSIDADLVFDPADPYAVTMVFRTGVQEVLWTFGRELLVEGRYEPTGDGDVHVWPCLSSNGSAGVIIEVCSPDGELLVQAGSRSVDNFVTA